MLGYAASALIETKTLLHLFTHPKELDSRDGCRKWEHRNIATLTFIFTAKNSGGNESGLFDYLQYARKRKTEENFKHKQTKRLYSEIIITSHVR